jgi:hypothetical protein
MSYNLVLYSIYCYAYYTQVSLYFSLTVKGDVYYLLH